MVNLTARVQVAKLFQNLYLYIFMYVWVLCRYLEVTRSFLVASTMSQRNKTTNAHRDDTIMAGEKREHDISTMNDMRGLKKLRSGQEVAPSVEPVVGLLDVAVTREEALRARLKDEELRTPGSSMKDTVTGNLSDFRSKGNTDQNRIDPYLLRLLSAEDASKISKGSFNKSKQSASTDFKVPDLPKGKVKQMKPTEPDSKGAAAGVQASNSLDKPKKDAQWDFMDTQNVLGEDTTDILRKSVIQNQREFVEQIYDLHRALAVQKLLVRHTNDQKALLQEYRKEEGRVKKARKKAGLGFGTTTSFHKGLHPDSQFAALSRDSGTDEDVSGDDLPGSGDDVAASGSGGNGKSGNGSGGGSTSHLNVAAGTSPCLMKGNGNGMQAPSGASNAPMLSWPAALMGQMAPSGPQGYQGMGPALIDIPQSGLLYSQPYGSDPMMMWYQDYFNRLASCGQDGKDEKGPALPAAFKWWRDPKLAFGMPADAKEVLQKSNRREGVEVESAPPGVGPSGVDTNGKSTTKSAKKVRASARLVTPAPKKRSHRRKRLPEDPVDEASSGTSGPAHHLESSDGGVARSPRSRDANVAKLLLSFSGKSMDQDSQRDCKRSTKK